MEEQDTIQNLVARHLITMKSVPADRNPHMEAGDWSSKAHHWKCTLKRKGLQFTVYFSMGMLRPEEPSIEEVIDCLRADRDSIESSGSFEDWASELGYDSDSRKAFKSYSVSKKQSFKFAGFMGREALDELDHCERL